MVVSHDNFDDYEDEEDEKSRKKKEKKDRIIWSKEPNFNDVFGPDFLKNLDFKDIEKIAEKLMKQFDFHSDKDPSKGPVVWGFSMSFGPDKKPIIRPFGNFNPKQKKKLLQGIREPLVDMINEETQISIIAEIPGVDNSDIKLKTTETMLTLSVDTPKRKYFKEIALPSEVDPNGAEARYKNGILEVKFKKRKSTGRGTTIRVD